MLKTLIPSKNKFLFSLTIQKNNLNYFNTKHTSINTIYGNRILKIKWFYCNFETWLDIQLACWSVFVSNGSNGTEWQVPPYLLYHDYWFDFCIQARNYIKRTYFRFNGKIEPRQWCCIEDKFCCLKAKFWVLQEFLWISCTPQS